MIALWPAWHGRNLGDRALVQGTRALLGQVTGDRIVEVPLGEAIPTGSTIVMPGGMHLSSYQGFPEIIGPLLRRKRAIVLPATFGPFTDEDAATFAKLRHPVAAREAASAGIASQLLGREVPVLADPALWALTGEPEAGTCTVFAPRREDLWFYHRKSTTRVTRTDAYRTYLPLVKQADDALIVAHSRADRDLCRALSRATGVPWARPPLAQLLDIYRTAKDVVASRYHGAIFGLGYGKPVTVIPFERHGHKMTVDLGMDVAALKAVTEEWLAGALA